MNAEGIMGFIEEGIVGFAGLAFFLLCVVPMLPFIAIGWLFSRALDTALAAAAKGGDVQQAPGEAPQSGPKGNAQ